MDEKYKMYCISLGESLNEAINDAIKNKKCVTINDKNDFNSGYLCGIHRIVTLMQQQAEIFDIPFEKIGISFDENELIL